MSRNGITATALLWGALLAAAVVTIFPFYWMLNTSLKPASEVFLSPPSFVSRSWSFSAYETLLTLRPFARYFLNSLIVSVGSTLFSLALPFSVWMLIGFFRSIPREIDEAAIVDGATRLVTFFRVVLSLARPGLVAVALFTFLISWNSYVWALVLTTDPQMFVLSVGVANMVGEYRVQWNELMAGAVIAAAPVMVLYALLERHLVSAITAGAVKG